MGLTDIVRRSVVIIGLPAAGYFGGNYLNERLTEARHLYNGEVPGKKSLDLPITGSLEAGMAQPSQVYVVLDDLNHDGLKDFVLAHQNSADKYLLKYDAPSRAFTVEPFVLKVVKPE